MLKSFINPQKILGNNPGDASPEAFSNFMMGNNSAASNVEQNSPANNISDFSRISEVKADISNLQSLISTISENISNTFNTNLNSVKNEIEIKTEGLQSQIQNITNTINNKVESSSSNNVTQNQIQNITEGIQTQVQTTLSKLIQNFTKDYQQKIQNKEDNKPSNILKGFLGLYQNAINFVTFFGDSKNNKRIENSLKGLRNMFNDSFNTALIIRQTIVKIVKQLSNLPSASASSGGLNLDVKVPGGPLKQAGGSTIGKFVKGGAGRMLGVGAIGAGAAGLGLMGMQAAKASQEEKLAETKKRGVGEEPNGFMEGLNNIVERFSDAIDSLLGGKKKSSEGGGGGAPDGGAPEGTMGAGLTDTTGNAAVDSSGLKSNFSPIIQDIAKSGLADTSKLSDRAAIAAMIGVGQMETNFPYDKAYTGRGGEENNMQGFIQLNRAVHPREAFQSKEGYLNYTFPKFQGKTSTFTGASAFKPLLFAKYLQNAKTGWDVANALKAAGFTVNDFDPLDTAEEANRLTNDQVEVLKKMVFNGMPVQPAVDAASKKPPSPTTPQAAQKPASTVKPAPALTSKVEPAPQKPEAQQVAQNITAPPGQDANTNVQIATATLPADITVIPGGGSQEGGGAIAPPPISGQSAAPDVSMYGMTANSHNPYWSLPYNLGILNA